MAERISSDCCANSCAEPPMGRITKYSATRFAAANTPSPTRIKVRGLPAGHALKRPLTSELLSIGHREVIAIERIGLRRRRRRLHAGVAKLRGPFQLAEQVQDGRNVFGPYHHVEQNLVIHI